MNADPLPAVSPSFFSADSFDSFLPPCQLSAGKSYYAAWPGAFFDSKDFSFILHGFFSQAVDGSLFSPRFSPTIPAANFSPTKGRLYEMSGFFPCLWKTELSTICFVLLPPVSFLNSFGHLSPTRPFLQLVHFFTP